MKIPRSSGVLLHITSLPNKFGIGTFGKEAYDFVNFLEKSGQTLWQILPLGPIGYGNSPYSCFSAFAGNHLLIDIEFLKNDGYLSNNDLQVNYNFSNEYVEYEKVIQIKDLLFKKAFENFKEQNINDEYNKFNKFCKDNDLWLKNYSVFMAIKKFSSGKSWLEWEQNYKFYNKEKLDEFIKNNTYSIEYEKFLQFLFFKQWIKLKDYANSKNIKIVGDIPLYIAMDSSDAWSNRKLFQFDDDLNPTFVAGVPPDYFSETGQLWGNPIYDWRYLKETNFKWWIDRIKSSMQLYDVLRIDHFRGLSEYWSVPYGEKTAIKGIYISAPGKNLFKKIKKILGEFDIIAEDLGDITPEVIHLRDRFNFPGMKILQFAFDEKETNNTFLPHTYNKNYVAYTGTHDNDTTLGWYESATKEERAYADEYLQIDKDNISWSFVRGVFASSANFAIVPLQDILGLDTKSRMNTPGTIGGNWEWRFDSKDLNNEISEKLLKLTNTYGRNSNLETNNEKKEFI